jgi:hypothetical protein
MARVHLSMTADLAKSDSWLMDVVLKDGGMVAWAVSDSIGGDCRTREF